MKIHSRHYIQSFIPTLKELGALFLLALILMVGLAIAGTIVVTPLVLGAVWICKQASVDPSKIDPGIVVGVLMVLVLIGGFWRSNAKALAQSDVKAED